MKKFDSDQEREIQLGLESGIDVSVYENPAYLAIQMQEIRIGLETGLDVSVYADPEFDWFQMEEIRRGLDDGLDVSKYAKKEIPHEVMEQIRKGFKEKLDMSKLTRFPAGVLKEFRLAHKKGIDLIPFIKKGYDDSQLEQIRLSYENKVDILPYLVKEMRGVAMAQIRLGLESGVSVKEYADVYYSWQQMREIRLGLEEGIDISQYNDYRYSWQQMHEIRLGLKSELDVSKYKSFVYSAKDMKKKREALLIMPQETNDFAELKKEDQEPLQQNTDYIVNENERIRRNIYFEGNVIINADIPYWVEIVAGGNVTINKSVTYIKIVSGKNVVIKEGIRGGNNCYIEANGNVEGKFFEGCKIKTGGNLTAGYTLNTDVDVAGTILMPEDKGSIVGGHIHAEKGIDVYNIGNKAMKHTLVEIGKGGVSRKDLKNIKKRIEFITTQISLIDNSMKKLKKRHTPEELYMMDTYIKLVSAKESKSEEVKSLTIRRDELEEAIEKNNEAKIRVRGTIFEGVTVCVAEQTWESKERKDVFITLSKNDYVKITPASEVKS